MLSPVDVAWTAGSGICKLQVVIDHQECDESLELVGSEEAAGADDVITRSETAGEIEYSPSVAAVSKGNVIRGRIHELMLGSFALDFTHAREPERVELVGAHVQRVVVVRGARCSSDERSGRDECAIRKRYILEDLSVEGNWAYTQ